jgi:hypothetical protein
MLLRHHRVVLILAFVVGFGGLVASAATSAPRQTGKPRVVLLTDIGGDVDDMQSLTRFLMYSDQFDIEGLLATSIRIFPEHAHRPPDGEPQPHYLVEWINAYAKVRDNLMRHTAGWPEPAALLAMVRKGAKTGRDRPFDIRTGIAGAGSGHFPLDQILGEHKDTEASQLLIEVVDRDDPRPVWICVWGGSLELAQALWRVRHERSPEEVKRFVGKLRVYAWGHQDATGPWIVEKFPDAFTIVPTGAIRYSADETFRARNWLTTHVRFNHGPLGGLTPLRKEELGEADSETFLGLIPNGLSVMERPDWGGWGGRFRRAAGSASHWIDLDENLEPATLGRTISRWAPHFQNDYQARMDWCVKGFNEANHPPVVKLDHPALLEARPGETVTLAATATDPDGDKLSYKWWHYADADSAESVVTIAHAPSPDRASFIVPNEPGRTVHIILEVTDSGTPPLTRYQRIVCTIR